MEDRRVIGKVLREARIAAGMSQSLLAELLGTTPDKLNKTEAGTRGFDEAWLAHLPPAIRGPVAAELERDCLERLEAIRGALLE